MTVTLDECYLCILWQLLYCIGKCVFQSILLDHAQIDYRRVYPSSGWKKIIEEKQMKSQCLLV